MRVLHLDSAREWRGGQTQLLHLVNGLSGRIEQAVAAPADSPLARALPVLPTDFRGPLGGVAAVRAAIRAFQPELVAAHTSRAHGAAVLATRRPVIVHRRVDFAPSPWSAWKYRAAAGYVAVSDAVAAVLGRAGHGPVVVVRDGVDPAPWRAPAPLRPVVGPWVLAAGALVPHKGHRHLVSAMRVLPGWTLVIAGEGPLRGALAAQAEREGVRLVLLGERRDLPSLVAGCDVFCHPSVEEGLGQVVAEALVTGVRLVTTRAGGLPELATGRGILVEPGDPAALGAALLLAPGRPKVRAEVLPLAAMVDGTLAAWERLLAVRLSA